GRGDAQRMLLEEAVFSATSSRHLRISWDAASGEVFCLPASAAEGQFDHAIDPHGLGGVEERVSSADLEDDLLEGEPRRLREVARARARLRVSAIVHRENAALRTAERRELTRDIEHVPTPAAGHDDEAHVRVADDGSR